MQVQKSILESIKSSKEKATEHQESTSAPKVENILLGRTPRSLETPRPFEIPVAPTRIVSIVDMATSAKGTTDATPACGSSHTPVLESQEPSLKRSKVVMKLHADCERPMVKRHGWDWYRNQLNSPKHICAPMVDQSHLAFRRLCLDYGTDLCYTPMINSKMLMTSMASERGSGREVVKPDYTCKFLEREFSTCEEERGKVIAQFCGDNPDILLQGARLIEHCVDGIDINCGCPQGIAKKGHYGSYLLEEPDLITSLVSTLHKGLEYAPVTVKIRKVNNNKTYQETLNLVEQIVAAGASAVTIHGRTKEEKGQHVKEADWEICI